MLLFANSCEREPLGVGLGCMLKGNNWLANAQFEQDFCRAIRIFVCAVIESSIHLELCCIAINDGVE